MPARPKDVEFWARIAKYFFVGAAIYWAVTGLLIVATLCTGGLTAIFLGPTEIQGLPAAILERIFVRHGTPITDFGPHHFDQIVAFILAGIIFGSIVASASIFESAYETFVAFLALNGSIFLCSLVCVNLLPLKMRDDLELRQFVLRSRTREGQAEKMVLALTQAKHQPGSEEEFMRRYNELDRFQQALVVRKCVSSCDENFALRMLSKYMVDPTSSPQNRMDVLMYYPQ